MKKLIALVLTFCLALGTAACGEAKPVQPAPPQTDAPAADTPTAAPETPALHLTRETMPRLDGSTSTAPLALALCAALLGETEDEVQDLVQFSKTTNAYLNLLHGGADLLIVGEANDEVFAEKEKLGFAWEQAPFATDAFVFVVNEDNPVNSITVDQARKIYTGEITNWKELGGEDRPITPLQRNSGAGSQTLMEKLVMQGTPMMEAPTDCIVATMGQLMTAVKSYDGSADAIGYSVYYYAEEMKMARGLKLLALEGVEPNPETIRSKAYPLVNPKYLVLPADAPADAPNRQLYNWLLSEAGQRLIAEEGYVSVLALDVKPRLTPLIGTRFYAERTEKLLCRRDYGQLLPYAGQRLMDDWPASTGCLYGLMTRDGRVVVDPVYSDVSCPAWYTPGGRGTLPMLLLRQDGNLAVAAADGSWCTGFDYLSCSASPEGLVLFTGEGLTLMRPDGSTERELSYGELGFDAEGWQQKLDEATWGEGWAGERIGDLLSIEILPGGGSIRCFDLTAGNSREMRIEDWNALYEQRNPTEMPAAPVIENAERLEDQLLGGGAPGLLTACDWKSEPAVTTFYRENGEPLPQFTRYGNNWYQRLRVLGGFIEVLDLNSAAYYDLETLDCVFQTSLGYEAD